MEEEFVVNSCVRGYHIYKDSWNASIGQFLQCCPENGNVHDPYCVAVVLLSSGQTVGHVPRSTCISAACNSFLRRNGSILCQVTGPKRYSADLAQGGLEVPCQFTFMAQQIRKLERLLRNHEHILSGNEPKRKKQKVDAKDETIDLSCQLVEVEPQG